jgi:hypothetical protein
MMKIGPAVAAAAVFAIASPLCAQDAVQWRVEDGGNGHWYRIVERPYGTYNWDATRSVCLGLAGDLATFESVTEWVFMRARCRELPPGPINSGQFLAGGSRDAGGSASWVWVSGSAFEYFAWSAGTPNDGVGQRNVLCVGRGLGDGTAVDGWDDWAVTDLSSGFIIEWSADCNSDGIVDYGQIRDGTFPDVNTNGVPDCCEPGESCTPCPGDVTNGGTVDAADLSILLAAWGTNGQGEFDTDLNSDGLVDGGDLALVLGGWGACP